MDFDLIRLVRFRLCVCTLLSDDGTDKLSRLQPYLLTSLLPPVVCKIPSTVYSRCPINYLVIRSLSPCTFALVVIRSLFAL